MRTEVPFDQIVSTLKQSRTVYSRLDDLARSIHDVGLLQNLVVKELPDGRLELIAGERRKRAIALLMLPIEKQIEQFGGPLGGWEAASQKSGCSEGMVPVFVIPENSTQAAHAIENIQRENLYPWELGKFFISWNDAGYTPEDIASHTSKSDSYVRRHMMIGRCLSPRISDALEKIGDQHFMSHRDLLKICRLFDPVYQEPKHDQQLELFEQLLGRVKRGPKSEESRSEKHRVFDRARRLGSLKVPGHAKPYVRAIYEYLFNPETVQKPQFNWK